VNKTYNSTEDFVAESEYDFTPQRDEVTLGINYIGDRALELANQEPVAWTGSRTTNGVTVPRGCSQTNNTAVDVNSGATTNYSLEYSCDPGDAGDPILSYELN